MAKNKYKVLETMEWRDQTLEEGKVVEDTHNGYIKAMIHLGKLVQIED